MTQSFGKSMSTTGSNFLKTPIPSSPAGSPPVVDSQESLDTRRLFQNIGLPPMARTLPLEEQEDIFAPPEDGKREAVGSTSAPAQTEAQAASPAACPNPAAAGAPTKEKHYDIPFHKHEKDILEHLSNFTKSAEFKTFESPRSRRSLTDNEGSTVLEELAQDFSTRTLTTRKGSSSEQVRDRLGRLVYEKFEEGGKWTARFLYYQDQAGKKSPFVMALKSLSSDGRFREVQYSKLGQIESEKETLFDLKLAFQ